MSENPIGFPTVRVLDGTVTQADLLHAIKIDKRQIDKRPIHNADATQMTRRLLTAEQAAELLQVPVSFVRQETRAERIPYIPIGARYKRYDADELEAWWRSRARGPWRSNE